jgi:hypothetical protein
VNQVELNFSGNGRSINDRIVIDGQDLSRHIVGVKLYARVGHVPQLVLDLLVTNKSAATAADADVHMEPDLAALLIKAGWTPPPGSLTLLDTARGPKPTEEPA